MTLYVDALILFRTVTFIANAPYQLLFIQAKIPGGQSDDAVGTWRYDSSENTAVPIFCGASSNALLDNSQHEDGVRTFTWMAPIAGVTDDIQFR